MIETTLIILEQVLLHFPLILGAYISISLLKVPDLSLESAYVCGAIMGAQTLVYLQGFPIGLQIIAVVVTSICGGALVGLTSSLITQKAGLPHLLSSIVTFGIFHGFNQLIANSYVPLSGFINPLSINLIPRYPEVIILGITALILSGLALYLFKTKLGYALAVYGNNPQFFMHYGININYVFIVGIVLANALAGLSGYLFAQSNGFAEMNMGFGKALLCITALILGKLITQINKPLYVIIPAVGLSAYFTLQQLLLKVGFTLKYFTMVQALLVLFVLITLYKKDGQTHIDHLGV